MAPALHPVSLFHPRLSNMAHGRTQAPHPRPTYELDGVTIGLALPPHFLVPEPRVRGDERRRATTRPSPLRREASAESEQRSSRIAEMLAEAHRAREERQAQRERERGEIDMAALRFRQSLEAFDEEHRRLCEMLVEKRRERTAAAMRILGLTDESTERRAAERDQARLGLRTTGPSATSNQSIWGLSPWNQTSRALDLVWNQ
ncbi:hypothetical protein B0H21DRAFT_825390 [Amylocystis lapponica]|nr:hypothetical protein B0H21DRAFT_825390 [Amylocystis lapponica]